MRLLENLGNAYCGTQQYDDALKVYSRLGALCKSFLGPSYYDTGSALLDMARMNGFLYRMDEALALFKEASEILHRLFPPFHRKLADVYYTEGEILRRCFRFDEAVTSHNKAIEIMNSLGTLDRDSENFKGCLLDALAAVYSSMGKYNEAIELALVSLHLFEKLVGTKSTKTANSLTSLGILYSHVGELKLAFNLCSRALTIHIETEGPNTAAASSSMNVLAELFEKAGRYDEAIITYLSVCYSEINGTPDVYKANTLFKLAMLFLSLLMYDEAQHYGNGALDTLERSGASDDKADRIAGCRSLLIEVCRRRGLHREAAALERQGPFFPFELKALAEVCASCFQQPAVDVCKGLMKCSICRIVRYCSKECQRTDWLRHKKFCKKTLKNT
mmetsp:Transcript_19063/g.31235  ORF Transcript_19063/g.31235 Transcript_19063/m.31235 type:complete len:389 (-) Transcript_19063:116-1282(-)